MVTFLIRRRRHGFSIPKEPRLPPKSLAWFRSALPRTTCYLEYGSGASTVMAAKQAQQVVSVESDSLFLDAVEKALAADGLASRCKLIHVDIGTTVRWGQPLWVWPTRARHARWRKYPIVPWLYLEEAGIQPDLILVDGRFRVACVLTSLLNLKNDSCPILLDDYEERREYRPVEAFADVVEMVDRMAVLRKKPNMDAERCTEVLERHHTCWR